MIDGRLAVSAGIGGVVAIGIAMMAFLSLGSSKSGATPYPVTPSIMHDARSSQISLTAGEPQASEADEAVAVAGFDHSEIGKLIRSYLNTHPEIVIEAIESYNAG